MNSFIFAGIVVAALLIGSEIFVGRRRGEAIYRWRAAGSHIALSMGQQLVNVRQRSRRGQTPFPSGALMRRLPQARSRAVSNTDRVVETPGGERLDSLGRTEHHELVAVADHGRGVGDDDLDSCTGLQGLPSWCD